MADPAPDPDDEMAVSTSFLPVIGVRGEITMPDGSNVRLYILKVVSALQATMMCDSEDDTKALCSLTGVSPFLILVFYVHYLAELCVHLQKSY